MEHNGARADNCSTADCDTLQHSGIEADPYIVLDCDRLRRNLFRLKMAVDGSELTVPCMPFASREGVCVVVENLDPMRDEHAMTNRDRLHRPDFAAWPDITPVTEGDAATRRKDLQLPHDPAVLPNRNGMASKWVGYCRLW